VADYYASSQQLKEAIPLYLRVLDLQPDDSNARGKVSRRIIVTHQRTKAIELLEEIIKQRPERYEAYDLLAQVLDDQARNLQRDNKPDEAKGLFRKSGRELRAKRSDQSAARHYLHSFGRVLLGPLREPQRAVRVLRDARQTFS